MNWTTIRSQLGNRSAIIAAGVAGFVIGAGGFVAAQIDDSPSAAELEIEAGSTLAASAPDTSTSPTSVDLTVPAVTVDDSTDSTVPDNTVDDSPSTSIDDSTHHTVPDNTIDDSTRHTVPDNTVDDSTRHTVPDNTVDDSPSTSIDDSTHHTVPGNSVPDSSVPDSSVPVAPPAPFSRTYQSTGGSIGVTWTGTGFVLDAVSPAPGFTAEIEDQRWDRIRVDFEGDRDDSRIEVRLSDDVPGGHVRVRIG